MFIILKDNNILDIVESVEKRDGNIYTEKSVIVVQGVEVVEVKEIPNGVEPNIFDYTKEKGFFMNESYLKNLEHDKEMKIEELNAQSLKAISGKFIVNIRGEDYEFSFDADAQLNFTGTLQFFNNNLIQEVEWTVFQGRKTRRIILNKNEFLKVAMAGFKHKDAQIRRFRNELQPLVEKAQRIEQLIDIKW